MPLQAGTKIGPYEIMAPIGAGGMGEVYRARDPRLSREVAIKVLPVSFSADPDRLRRFEQEARAAGILNHPNITAVHDIGTHDGAPYVVQELLEGETLRSELAGGRLPPRRVIDYSLQIVKGLAAAHEKGIVHRDLKPENIFVTNDGRVKILDFGLAKLTHTEERPEATNLPTATGTEPGLVLGTIGYMSPEQIKGKPADARSDIFSFGAILYEMLSGKRAFHGDSAGETMASILKEEPPDLSVTNQAISPALERIVRHCLEKNPERRFHSAHDVAFDLEALSSVSAGGPVSGAAAVPGARGGRWLVPAAAVALAALCLALGWALGHRQAPVAKASAITYTPLTFRQEPIFNARFSPDGKTIVFCAAPSGNAPSIFSLRLDYPGIPPAGKAGMALLSVSSKGELAVLTQPRYLRHSFFIGTLARMPLEGGAPREIVSGVREADWNPDGSDLTVIRDVKGKDRLEYPLGKILAETGGYFSNPRFSPRGDHIAFFEHPIKYDDRGSVAVVDLSGKKTVLAQGLGAEEGLAWSRDGQEVLFSGGTAYNAFEIYGVTLDGRRRTAVQSAGGLTIHDVAADGRWIASRDDVWRDIPVLAPGADHERNLAWLDLSYAVALTPDARTLLFTEESANAGNNYSTCLRGTDGSPVVRLGDGSALDISRDGNWALAVIPTEPQQLVLYPTGPGQPRKIESGGIVSYETAILFPDGRRVLACGHESGHGVRCYVQDLDGGKPRPISPEGTTEGFPSPDGRLALVRESAGGLRIYPVDGGPSREVPGATPDDGVIRWSLDGRSILVGSVWDVPAHIEKLDLSTGRREPFATLGPTDLTGVLQIGPIVIGDDGRSHAYTDRRIASHLFLMTGAR